MTLRPYPEYQDSGVDWLGDIPAHWEIIPLRAITKVKNERNRPDLPLLSVYREYGVILRDSRDDNFNPYGSNPASYKIVQPGDLVLNKMKTWQGSLGVSQYKGIVSPAYIVCKLNGDVHPSFLHLLLRSKTYVGFYNRISFGVRVNQWDMRYQDFKQTPVLLPPPDEQAAIVTFLDAAEKRIRRYIRAKQKLIKLLNEQKQAIIQQAVTHGLDPNVPMKDSGVEWLGEIPVHWDLVKLKYLVSVLGGMTPSKSESEYWGGDILWASPKDMKVDVIYDTQNHITSLAVEKTGISIVPESSVLMVVRGMILARKVPVAITGCPLTINQDMKALVPGSKINVDYLRLIFEGMSPILLYLIEESGHGTRRFPTENWENLKIPLPSLEEQIVIIELIAEETRDYDIALNLASNQIDHIQEYRTRLIADVVTGKVDVRGMAFEMPEDFDEADLIDVDADDRLEDDEMENIMDE